MSDAVPEVLVTGPPAPARRPRLRVLAALAAVIVVTLGIAVAGLVFGPGRAILAQYPAAFSAPQKLERLHRTENPALRSAETATVAKLRADGVAEPFAVYYEDDIYDHNLVSVIGATRFSWSESDGLDGAFALAGPGTLEVTDRKDVDPGDIGGAMQCASATYRSGGRQRMSICAWADHGSVGMAMFYARDVKESATMLRAIRDAGLRR